MRMLRFLFVVSLTAGIFLLATGLLDLGRIGADGSVVWSPRLDRAGLERLIQPVFASTAAAPSAAARSTSH